MERCGVRPGNKSGQKTNHFCWVVTCLGQLLDGGSVGTSGGAGRVEREAAAESSSCNADKNFVSRSPGCFSCLS